jgi:hypothetical protein
VYVSASEERHPLALSLTACGLGRVEAQSVSAILG